MSCYMGGNGSKQKRRAWENTALALVQKILLVLDDQLLRQITCIAHEAKQI